MIVATTRDHYSEKEHNYTQCIETFFSFYDSLLMKQTKPQMDLSTEKEIKKNKTTHYVSGFGYKGAERLTKERHNAATGLRPEP